MAARQVAGTVARRGIRALTHTSKRPEIVFLRRYGNTRPKFRATPGANHRPNLIAEVRLGPGLSANQKSTSQYLCFRFALPAQMVERTSPGGSEAIIPALMPLASGSKLGPYEIVRPLGAGGMGEVYRARDTRLGRHVALKILPASISADPVAKQRFEREAKA
jgi:serine/threonine protein kinase